MTAVAHLNEDHLLLVRDKCDFLTSCHFGDHLSRRIALCNKGFVSRFVKLVVIFFCTFLSWNEDMCLH